MNTRKTLPDFDVIFEAAAAHVVEVGASKFSVCEIAETLNVSTDMLSPLFDDLYSFAASFGRYIDGLVVKDAPASDSLSDEPGRDRLFEILMSRFDELEPFKACVAKLGKAAARDPKLAAVIAARVPQSMALMLSLSQVAAKGYKKPLQVAGLTALWLRTARTWLKDESEDMAKTMAALDKSLENVDSIARRVF